MNSVGGYHYTVLNCITLDNVVTPEIGMLYVSFVPLITNNLTTDAIALFSFLSSVKHFPEKTIRAVDVR